MTHFGAYNTLSESYERVRDWAEAQDIELGEGSWESYVDDPSKVQDVADLRTEIYWPIS